MPSPLEFRRESPAERAAHAGHAAATGSDDVVLFDADGGRVLRHRAGRLPDICDAALAAIAESDSGVYVSAGGLVRVYAQPADTTGAIRRRAGALIQHAIDSTHLAETLGRVARHEKFDARAREWVPCDCPRRVSETLLARGHWPELRYLTGIIEAPTITPAGRVIDLPGHDPDTGLFYAPGALPGYARPPEQASQAQALDAVDYLLRLIDTFPLVEPTDRVAVLSGLLTALVRRLLPAAPLWAITAPSPGTGKTLLAETFAMVATGRRSSVLALGQDDAEAEKRLGGVLLAGDVAVLLDNIERPLGGDLLCQVTTQPSIRLRPLGGSTMLSVPTHAILVATGNNLAITGDLKRRVVLVRLDARDERPELRTFSADHLAHVAAERGRIVAACLTVIAAYLHARTPPVDGLRPYGSFEEWDRLCRRPLCWMGLDDPLLASESLRAQDPDIEAMRLLFTAWRDRYGDAAVGVADVVRDGLAYGSGMSGEHDSPELYAALQLTCAEKVNSRRLGFWLRRHKDRIVDGMRLDQFEIDRNGVARWRIVS